jgi:DNA-binding LytR/AlgR family response regulator
MDNRKTRCLIVDDEPLAIKLIRTHLSKIDSFEVVGECRNALRAVDYLKDGSVDLMFLDINMPEITGLDFLKTLQNPPYVIITTAYREYAIEGYDLDVVDFLLKPISFERFLKAINRFCNRTRSQLNKDDKSLNQSDSGKCIHIQDGKNIFRLPYESIIYFEGYGEYVKVNTTGKTYMVRDSLTEFENKLLPGNFTRIHKSYIINIRKVTGFSPIHVFLDKTELPVGRSHRDRVMGILRAEGKN